MTPLPETPLVTIVTPSYNMGAFIEETVKSVQQQDWPRIEHIVLDSGSKDGTLEILARYPSVRLIKDGPPSLTGKINAGFAMARGEIVAWMNADDFYLPGAVTKAVNALKRTPEAAAVYCNVLQVDEESVETDRWRTRQVGWREMLTNNYTPLETLFLRKEAVEQVGPLTDRYPLVQDWDLFIRISKRFPMLYVDDWWSAYRYRLQQRSDFYKYECWTQSRQMTREHGAHLLPLLRDYWGTKARRAVLMVRRGQFGRLLGKGRRYIASFSRVSSTPRGVDY